jgi:AraC-like DNA-binding protein
MHGQIDQIPLNFRGIINECNEKYYNRIATMTPSIHITIHQILNCPYYGVIKQMYLESKAIELISCQLAQLFAETQCKTPLVLRPDDIERIREARDILARNMENPPFLQELAKQVGINVTKLKRGFRQVYGTSVFGYLRYHRLEEARQLLAEGKMSVTEVVFAVGYSSPSYFTSAFAKYFGINPGAYLQGTRKNTTPQIQNMQ